MEGARGARGLAFETSKSSEGGGGSLERRPGSGLLCADAFFHLMCRQRLFVFTVGETAGDRPGWTPPTPQLQLLAVFPARLCQVGQITRCSRAAGRGGPAPGLTAALESGGAAEADGASRDAARSPVLRALASPRPRTERQRPPEPRGGQREKSEMPKRWRRGKEEGEGMTAGQLGGIWAAAARKPAAPEDPTHLGSARLL